MFRETRKHKPRKIHFEIIPMIDVMMILVLFLSVMAFLPQVQSAIQTDLPESGSDNEVSIDDVLITMKVTDSPMAAISVNDSSVSESELIDKIKTEMGNNKKKRVVIAADKDLSYDEVVKVLAKLQAAKISNVALATKKGE